MFRVTNNPRCLESCRLICQSLLTLASEKDLDRVTIAAVSSKSGVSRTTFYKHFDSLQDVLAWHVEVEVHESFRGANFLAQYDIAALTHMVFHYWVGRAALLELLLKNNQYALFTNALFKAFDIYFGPIIDNSRISEETKPYLIDIYPAVTSSILRTWILRGKKESVEKLASISLQNNTFPA